MIILNILKGVIYGGFSILPGLSGSMLAAYFGDYNKIIDIFVEKKLNKENILYITFIFIGFILGIVCLSKILLYLFDNFKLMFKYIIFILNLIILIFILFKNNIKIIKLLKYITLSLLFIIVINNINIDLSNNTYFFIFFVSFLYSAGKLIPGISCTTLMINLNVYDVILGFFSNPIKFFFNDVIVWMLFWIMFVISSIVIVYFVYKFNKNHKLDELLVVIQLINLLTLLK